MKKDPLRIVLADVDGRMFLVMESNMDSLPIFLDVPMMRNTGGAAFDKVFTAETPPPGFEIYKIRFARSYPEGMPAGTALYKATRTLTPNEQRVFIESHSKPGASINYQEMFKKPIGDLTKALDESVKSLAEKLDKEIMANVDPIKELRDNETKMEAKQRESDVMDLMLDIMGDQRD